jgi:hypothetical protein
MRSRRSGGSSIANSKAAREKERQRRQQAVGKARAALGEAEAMHVEKSAAIDAERDACEKRSQAEDARWESRNASRRAQSGGHAKPDGYGRHRRGAGAENFSPPP